VIDTTVHLGDIITTFIAAIVTLIGWGVRKMFFSVYRFIKSVDGYEERIESSAEVIDLHTDALAKSGWLHEDVKLVSKKRRATDRSSFRGSY